VKQTLRRESNNCFVKIRRSNYDGKIEVVKLENDDNYASDDSGALNLKQSPVAKMRRIISRNQ
jgi:hypothetical protein